MKKCSRCGQLKPADTFRRRATYAEQKKVNRAWIRTAWCPACAKPRKKKGPEALRKELALHKKLPELVVAHRVETRRRVNADARVDKLRVSLRERYAQATQATLAALDKHAASVRYRARTGATPITRWYTDYASWLKYYRVFLTKRALEGRAPPDPWWSRVTPETMPGLPALVEQGEELALGAGWVYPPWWTDRALLLDPVRARAQKANAQRESLAAHKAALEAATLAGDMTTVMRLVAERKEKNRAARARGRS